MFFFNIFNFNLAREACELFWFYFIFSLKTGMDFDLVRKNTFETYFIINTCAKREKNFGPCFGIKILSISNLEGKTRAKRAILFFDQPSNKNAKKQFFCVPADSGGIKWRVAEKSNSAPAPPFPPIGGNGGIKEN